MVTAATPDTERLFTAEAGTVTVLEVPELPFASVDGSGTPDGAAFGNAIHGLYTVAYGVRFGLKRVGIDEKVSPLEALWWTDDPAGDFAAALARGGFTGAEKASWSWRAMIRLPWAADDTVVGAVKEEAVRRHPEMQADLDNVRVGPWCEGLSVQTLHVGPYATELVSVTLLHDFIAEHGYRAAGLHHEVYLSDPRRCAPERIRTILRQPVERAV